MDPDQFAQLITALNNIDTSIEWMCFWVFLILVFKDCKGD